MSDTLLYISYDNLNYKQHLQVNYVYPVYPTGIDILLVGELLNTNVRMFTRMVKVISLISYCTMLDIIALVDVWKVAVGLS